MDSFLKVVLKFVVILFVVMSTLVGGVQGNEIVQGHEEKVCLPYLPCYKSIKLYGFFLLFFQLYMWAWKRYIMFLIIL